LWVWGTKNTYEFSEAVGFKSDHTEEQEIALQIFIKFLVQDRGFENGMCMNGD
jgi:hypothetical protein